MQYLCFVEFEDELKVLENRFRGEAELIFVPLTERVRKLVRSRECATITVDELLTDRTHLRALSAVQRWEGQVASVLEGVQASLSASSSFMGHFRFVLQYALLLTDLVLTASHRYPHATLAAAKVPFVPSGTGEIKFGTQRVLGQIVESVADAMRRPCRVIQIESSERATSRRMGRLSGALLSTVNRLLVRMLAQRRVVVVPSLAYGMPHLTAILQRHGAAVVLFREGGREALRCLAGAVWSIVSLLLGVKSDGNALGGVSGVLSVPLLRTERSGTWQGVAERVLQDPFIYRGVPLANVLREKVLIDIADASDRADTLTRQYERLFRRLRPTIILSQMARWGNGMALGEAGTREGVPSILISHGSHVEPRSRIEAMTVQDHATGLLHSPVYRLAAVQSPAAEQVLRNIAPSTVYVRCRPVMWGYRAVSEGRRPPCAEPVILHAGTAKPRWAWRPWWYETIEEYILGLKDLIRAVEGLDRGRLVVRFRPFAECSLDDLRASLPVSERVTIKTGGSFLEDLATADLLVSFSSTTIEEALHARRPVLQYGGGGRYHHLPGLHWGDEPLRRSAVYSVSKAGDLAPALAWILERHAGNQLTDEELKGYVFVEGEAMSTAQFAAALVHPHLLEPWIKTAMPISKPSPVVEQVSVC